MREPFATLVAEYPGEEVYPSADFRVEWGPIFHRGRLDGSARVLVLGQDPATHESISRRILVGEAGQRVQGLLAKVGITDSYVMVNTFLYSVFGQQGGEEHARDAAIAAYRNRWLDALLVDTEVTAVLALGRLARTAYQQWAETQPATAERLHLAAVRHPTYPESAAAGHGQAAVGDDREPAGRLERASARPGRARDPGGPGRPGPVLPTAGCEGDLAAIPERDLPPGCPAWWRDLLSWADRDGESRQAKRATIVVAVPRRWQTWPRL